MATGYGDRGWLIRVDMTHELAIIIDGGKIGKPLSDKFLHQSYMG